MHHSMKVCLTALALASPLTGLLGCAPTEPTQIVAGMVTQMRVPEEIRSVGLLVMSGGRLIHCKNYQVDDETDLVHLPSTYATSSEGEYTRPLTITVLGFPENNEQFERECVVVPQVGEGPKPPQIMRRRSSTFIANEALFLPMPLRHSCDGVKCTGNTTCIAGRCVAEIEMPSDSLPVFDPARSTGADSTCFDISQCANETLPTTLEPTLVNPDTCEFELDIPQDVHALLPANAGINVVVRHDNLTPEILDLDAEEGFVVPADSNGLARFRLSSGLCESRYKKGLLTSIQATVACPSKPPTQAMCIDQQRQLIAGKVDSLLVQTPLPRGKIELELQRRSTFVLVHHKELSSALANFANGRGLVKESDAAKGDSRQGLYFLGAALFTVLDSRLMEGSFVRLAPLAVSADANVFKNLEALTVPLSYDQDRLQKELKKVWPAKTTPTNGCLPHKEIIEQLGSDRGAESKSLIIISDSANPMPSGNSNSLALCNTDKLSTAVKELSEKLIDVRVVVDVSALDSKSQDVKANWAKALRGSDDHQDDDEDDDKDDDKDDDDNNITPVKISTLEKPSGEKQKEWVEGMIAKVMGKSCRFKLPEAWNTWSDDQKRAARIVASRQVPTEERGNASALSYGLCPAHQDSNAKAECFKVVSDRFIELFGTACTDMQLNAMWPSIQANLARTQSKELPYSSPYLVQLVP